MREALAEARLAADAGEVPVGAVVVRNGQVVKVTWGSTHTVKPEFDRSIEKDLKKYFDRYHTINMENFKVRDDEIAEGGRGKVIVQACEGRRERSE